MKRYKSAFHVTEDPSSADESIRKMDLLIDILETNKRSKQKIDQNTYNNLSNAKIEKYTIDEMVDILSKLSNNIDKPSTPFYYD